MTTTNFDTEQEYDDERLSTVEVFQSNRMKAGCGYFGPGQFVPVHGPSSDVAVHVQTRSGSVRDGDKHHVKADDVAVVEADTGRGLRADTDSKLETVPVTAPPPNDIEHEPVRTGLQNDQFDPQRRNS